MSLMFSGIKLPPVKDKESYVKVPEEKRIRRILRELDEDSELSYLVSFEDHHEDTVCDASFTSLQLSDDESEKSIYCLARPYNFIQPLRNLCIP